MGSERGRGGNSKGNPSRGRGRGKGKGIAESSSSVGSSQVQQPAQGTLIKEALPPADSGSNIASTANASALSRGSQEPTTTRLGSAPEDITVADSEQIHPQLPVTSPQRVGEPEGHKGIKDCDNNNTADVRPLTHSAKRRNRRRAKAGKNSHVNTGDATAQPSVDHLAPAPAPAPASSPEEYEIHTPSPVDTTIFVSQSKDLNGSDAHVPFVVDNDLVSPIVAGVELPFNSASVDGNNSLSVPPGAHNSLNVHAVSTTAAVGAGVGSHGQASTRPRRRRNKCKPKAKDSITVQTEPTIGKGQSTSPEAVPAENPILSVLSTVSTHTLSYYQEIAELTLGPRFRPVGSKETVDNDNIVDPGALVADTSTGRSNDKRRLTSKKQKDKAEAATSCSDDAKKSVHAEGTTGGIGINNCEQHVVSPEPEQKPVQRSQYQHFIPVLVLKAFATAEALKGRGNRDTPVNVYSMKDACITPTPVGRCYGYSNMYQDASAADEMHIEKALGVLESRAASAIMKVKKAQDRGASSVTLTRVERNNIRKFLFVMMYRDPGFWVKYNCTLEDYQHIDRELALKFMRKRRFTKLIDIWLHCLKTILDTPIDPKNEWEKTILESCFTPDGLWFIHNMNDFFMTFIQPANPENEFIITDSAFGIHEGPTKISQPLNADMTAEFSWERLQLQDESKDTDSYYTEFHKMAPLSPKLLLVLRWHCLANEEAKRNLRETADILRFRGSHQFKSPSIFDKLHLDLPRPTYAIAPLNHTNKDTFEFTLHKISDKFVDQFNFLFLQHVTRNITWRSNAALKRTLTEYLDAEEFLVPTNISLALGEEQLRGL